MKRATVQRSLKGKTKDADVGPSDSVTPHRACETQRHQPEEHHTSGMS